MTDNWQKTVVDKHESLNSTVLQLSVTWWLFVTITTTEIYDNWTQLRGNGEILWQRPNSAAQNSTAHWKLCALAMSIWCWRHTHTHTHPFNGPMPGTTQVSQYQKGKTNLDFAEARDSEWQWHQLGYMQVCTSLQTDNHASTPPLSFLQTGCPSCCPNNSIKVYS